MDAFILETLLYFQNFEYAPTFDEVYIYLVKKVGKNDLKNKLKTLINRKKIKKYYIDSTIRYTLGEYSKSNSKFKIKNLKIKNRNSKLKINGIKKYLWLLSIFPQIRLVGLSGSVAMMNAEKTDDVDVFIISAPKRMWTARFLAVVTARILGRGRKRLQMRGEYGGKVCLNLFFDGNNLALPQRKRTLYGAHEVLQMKPLINKENACERFLKANMWVFEVFPNVSSVILSEAKDLSITARIPHSRGILHSVQNDKGTQLGSMIESILKYLQLFLIRRHQTTELITDTQLWFHPDDYQKKMKPISNR